VRANLPTEVSAAENEAFQAIGRWATVSGITFSSLAPQWQTHDEGYDTFECRATATGTQAQLARFIYELESDKVPVSLDEFEITTRDEHGQQLTMTARFSFLRMDLSGKAGS
jgi:Tfp pilus assembly protein PilO